MEHLGSLYVGDGELPFWSGEDFHDDFRKYRFSLGEKK